MNREILEEIAAMATALTIAYWAIVFTGFVWEVICAVAKSAITNTLVP